MEIGENYDKIQQKKIKISGLVISSLLCQNNLINCFFKEYKDEIDESYFSRNEECNHYYIRMGRKIIKEKVNISVTFECKKCKNSETKTSENFEKEFEFDCCGQNKIKFSYFISLIEDNKQLIDDSIIKNEINDSIIKNINNNNDNIPFNNLIDNDVEDIKNNNKDVNIKIVNVRPWSYIAEDNKITLRFKYYKKTEVNYHIQCSKKFFFSDVMKEFIKAIDIKEKVIISICDCKKLDGEKSIDELELKENDLIIVR